jgi:2-iminobutanoate/2-iminopropanoate deaminase
VSPINEDTATLKTGIQKETVLAPNAPKGRGPFPHAVRFDGQLFVSGQGPLDLDRNEPDTGTFAHEAHLTIQNLARVVQAAGCALSDAVKLTIYLSDISNVPEFNEIYRQYFEESPPARTLVEVGLRGIQVEIDGIFACPREVAKAAAEPGPGPDS